MAVLFGPTPALAQPVDDPPEGAAIIVTGTRIQNPAIESPSPVQAIGADTLRLTGAATVEATLNQLPQIVPGFTNTSNNPGSGAATLDLRGLGSFRTLILVDGRRWIANNAGSIPEVDVNTIPSALVERVDIVTGGASAVYGSDAVTGVVNFVLRRKFEGLEAEAQQTIAEAGDARTWAADLTGGMALFGGRGHAVLSVGVLDRADVRQDARTPSRLTLFDGCALAGTRTATGASTPAPNLNGDCSGPNEEIAFIAGGSGSIPTLRVPRATFVPVAGSSTLVRAPMGIRFDPDGTPRPFNLATDSFNFAPENFLQVPLRRHSAHFLGSFDISPAIEPFVNASYIRTRSDQQLASTPVIVGGAATSVPAPILNLNNPFITAETRRILDLNFGVDVAGRRGIVNSQLNPAFLGDADGIVQVRNLLRRLTEGDSRRILNRREAWRVLGGVRGELGGSWTYEAAYSRSNVAHRANIENGVSFLRFQQAILAVRDPATGQVRCLDPSNGCVPANVFGAGNVSAEAAAFIRTDALNRTDIGEQVADASVQGSPLSFGGEPVLVAAGASWRRNTFDYAPDTLLGGNDLASFTTNPVPASGFTRVWELFGEAQVPLLSDRPFAHELGVELGLRYSNYRSVGSTWTWKALASWAPVAGLRLRGGLQRAVRAPNVLELFEAESFTQAFVEDPCAASTGLVGNPAVAAACVRNGVPASDIGTFDAFGTGVVRAGGPGRLEAEIADTLTLGAVVKPAAIPGLTATVDFYDIHIRRPIGPFGGGPFSTLLGCIALGGDPASELCRAVVRDTDGSLLSIDSITANNEQARARGIDWQIAWKRDLGDLDLDLSLSGTRYFKSAYQANGGLPLIDCTGRVSIGFFANGCGGLGRAIPRWKLFNQVGIGTKAVRATLRHRWFSSTTDGRPVLDAAVGFPDSTATIAPEGFRLEARHYLDFGVSVDAGERLTVAGGVNNLTGAKPAITGFGQAANTDPTLYDTLGRRFFVDVRVRFGGASRRAR